MPRRMAFSKTIEQMRDRSKTVTRRFGWWDEKSDQPRVQPGDTITAIEKGMGLKLGERQVVLGRIEVVSIRRERLEAITADELAKEGFPGMTPSDFFGLIGGNPEDIVTRIEFRHLEAQ